MNLRIVILIALLSTLSACQKYQMKNYIADQNKQYVAATTEAPLRIPAQLDSKDLRSDVIVIPALPATNNPVVRAEPSLLPPGSIAAQVQAGTLPASVLKTKLPDPQS